MIKIYTLLLLGLLIPCATRPMEKSLDLSRLLEDDENLEAEETPESLLKRPREEEETLEAHSEAASTETYKSNKKTKTYSKLPQAQKDQLLLQAAESGNLDDLKALLKAGANIEGKDGKGAPLRKASAIGNLACVEALLEEGAQVNATNKFNETALHYASDEGHLDCVKALLKAGADREKGSDNNKYQVPLSYAAGSNHRACVEALLDEKPYSEYYIDNALLDGAFLGASDDTKKILLKAQLDSPLSEKEKNYEHLQLLRYAAEVNYPEALKSLLEAGLYIDATDPNFGATALHVAVGKGHTECAKILLNHGASKEIDAEDDEYSGDPLETAVLHEQKECIKLLIEDTCSQKSLENAVHRAIEWDCPASLKSLIDAKVLLDDALLYAAKDKNCDWNSRKLPVPAEIIKLLIEAQADLNYQDSKGATPLHHAAQNGHLKMAEVLLIHGADETIEDNEGFTYLDYAIINEHNEIVELGLKHTLGKESTIYKLTLADGELSSLWIGNISETVKDLAEFVGNIEKKSIVLNDITTKTWNNIVPHLRNLFFITWINEHIRRLKDLDWWDVDIVAVGKSIIEPHSKPILEALNKLNKEDLQDLLNAANYLNIQALVNISCVVLAEKSITQGLTTNMEKLPKNLKKIVLLSAKHSAKYWIDLMLQALNKKKTN